MKIIKASTEIICIPPEYDAMRRIELAARNCYKSEDKIAQGSADSLIKSAIKAGHESIIEHVSATVRIICDRGIMAEITRHRVGIVFSIESSRYVNYSKEKFGSEITFIHPCKFEPGSELYLAWERQMRSAEIAYLDLIDLGAKPEFARSVLPSSTKTDIVMTANLSSWRHMFNLRCSPKAHPQIREVMIPLLTQFTEWCPIIFEDIHQKYCRKTTK